MMMITVMIKRIVIDDNYDDCGCRNEQYYIIQNIQCMCMQWNRRVITLIARSTYSAAKKLSLVY